MSIGSSKTRAVVVHGVCDVRVDEMPLAPLRRTDVRVRTHYSGISVGTERWLITGQRPDAPFPTITGYQNCGVVEEVGSMVKSVVVGERVSVGTTRVVPPIHQGWAGHVETVIADAGLVVGIPDAVSWESAALERLAAVGLRGARMANIRYGDNVVIIGQGMIGHLLGQICRSWDANVVVAERLSMRRDLSRQWVTDAVLDPEEVDLVAEVQRHFPGGADVVVEASGFAENLPMCLEMVREQGRILLQGWYPGDISFNFQRAHHKRITVHFPCYLEGEDVVLTMIEREQLHIEPLITHIFPSYQAPEAFRLVVEEPESIMGMLLDWN